MPAADVIAANAAAQSQSPHEGQSSPSVSATANGANLGASVVAHVESAAAIAGAYSEAYLPAPAHAMLKGGGAAVWAATDRFAKLPFVSRRLLLVQNGVANGVAAFTAAAGQAQAKAISLRDASTAKVAEVREATTARVASIRDASHHLLTTTVATAQSAAAAGSDKVAHLRTDIVSLAESSLASARIVLDQRVTPRATEAVHVTRERLSATVAKVQVQLDQLRASLATVAADPRVAPIVDRVTPVAVATRARVDAVVSSITKNATELTTASAAFLKAHPIRGMPAEALARARVVRDNATGRVQALLATASADPRYALVADRVRPLTASLIELFRHTKAAAAAAAASIHIGGTTIVPVATTDKAAAATPEPTTTTTTSSSSSVATGEPTPVAVVATEEKNVTPVVAVAATPVVEPVATVATPVDEEVKGGDATTSAVEEETPVEAVATPVVAAPVPVVAAAPAAEPSPVTPQRRAAGAGNRKPKSAAKKGK